MKMNLSLIVLFGLTQTVIPRVIPVRILSALTGTALIRPPAYHIPRFFTALCMWVGFPTQTIQAASGEYLGRPVNVRILLSGMDAPVEERDKMEELIRAGSKYDCFVVK